MTGPHKKLIAAVEAYFADLRRVRASGGGTGERSHYPALANFLGSVGQGLKPKVFCVLEGADQGAGHPDYALYTAKQVQKGRPRGGQVPERGVVEMKAVTEDAWLTAKSDQVSRYWGHYRLVLVTNLRDFVLVGADGSGNPATLETFQLAEDADDFWRKVETPRAFAHEVGAGLGEYLAQQWSERARCPARARRPAGGRVQDSPLPRRAPHHQVCRRGRDALSPRGDVRRPGIHLQERPRRTRHGVRPRRTRVRNSRLGEAQALPCYRASSAGHLVRPSSPRLHSQRFTPILPEGELSHRAGTITTEDEARLGTPEVEVRL